MLDLATGRYVMMSPSQVELTGFGAEEMDNLSVEDAYARVHPNDRERSISQQKEVAAGRDVGPVEYPWKVKNGDHAWQTPTHSCPPCLPVSTHATLLAFRLRWAKISASGPVPPTASSPDCFRPLDASSVRA